MNAPLRTINTALSARGLLPMDGFCSCDVCGRVDLRRDQMNDPAQYSRPICSECLSYLLRGKRKCIECDGTGGATRVRDYVRGDRTEFCIRCDGYGEVHVGIPAWLEGVA